LAREYGFQSWTALKAEVARRRLPRLRTGGPSAGAQLAKDLGRWLAIAVLAAAFALRRMQVRRTGRHEVGV